MANWTNTDKSSAPSWSEQSKNSASWTLADKQSYRTFDEVPLSEIEDNTFDGLFHGKVIDDWVFSDLVNTTWVNANKS